MRIPEFVNIFNVFANIITGVYNDSTAIVILMLMIAGLYLMFDRNTSFAGRLERLSFVKGVLIGYAFVVGAHFAANLLVDALASGGITAPTLPLLPTPTPGITPTLTP